MNEIIGILALVCCIWVIFDAWARNNRLSTGMKVLWTILGLFFSILTAIVYYFVYKR